MSIPKKGQEANLEANNNKELSYYNGFHDEWGCWSSRIRKQTRNTPLITKYKLYTPYWTQFQDSK